VLAGQVTASHQVPDDDRSRGIAFGSQWFGIEHFLHELRNSEHGFTNRS
jgi:hypothetical protein